MSTEVTLEQISFLLDQKLEEKLEFLEQRLDQKLEQKLNLKLAPIQKTLKSHGKLLKSLKVNQDVMLEMLDREQMNQRKRLEAIENYLHFPASIK